MHEFDVDHEQPGDVDSFIRAKLSIDRLELIFEEVLQSNGRIVYLIIVGLVFMGLAFIVKIRELQAAENQLVAARVALEAANKQLSETRLENRRVWSGLVNEMDGNR